MQTIGERLEEARKRKGISIREAAESTKIRSDYLHKFESNQYDLRLPEIYVRGFLRSYAAFLKLPPDKIIADYNALSSASESRHGTRSVNREVYGRMDISTTKEPKAHDGEAAPARAGGTAPPMATATPSAETAATASPSAATPRNPITFVPPHSSGSPIDKKFLIKGIALIVLTLLILIFLIILVFSHGGSATSTGGKATATSAARANAEILAPQAGEKTFDIVAQNGPVTIKASMGATVYFQDTLQPGEKKTLPRRVGMRIETLNNASYANLLLVFDGKSYPITGPQEILN